MNNRILKDIRYYESDKPNIEGQSLPGNLGGIFLPTKDTNYIGQRIARKLNELKYSFGECDHLYINLTTVIGENQIQVCNRNIDKTIKYIDFGVSQSRYNSLTDEQKETFLKSSTINILKSISDKENLELIKEMEKQVLQFDTGLNIHYKTKETSVYKIDIYYQIAPRDSFTKAIIEYQEKKTGPVIGLISNYIFTRTFIYW
ncbi:hypothetical protein [Chitinophaga polysaccharea]|uniref:hypothetical protein n=1 Tax=Chitinophaga polysaccharea TaxID=1293035 RepID=UPI0011573ED4|nr:hypothetical protein [Chitinophaga polysaccharea]